ncbi:MAG: 1-acyl-sn-glycerol-3-phosphate acyltransferase [Candidatus Lokiarchaeota archaeon]|nr:1-acyl-sn-glycerol-3-phosphate acyltransferase [Candidatus Lokiarchaeota archaeon]
MSTSQGPGEAPEKEEKKENAMYGALKKFVLKPVDSAFVQLLNMVEQAGFSKQIQYPHYLNQDAFWWAVMNGFFNMEITGSEHVPPEGQGAIVASNHSSMFDPLVQGVALCHYTRRRIHEMGKEEIFTWPLINAYLRWIYGFPVKRGEHDVEAFEKALELVKAGEIVGMFPEGTINEGGANFLEAKTGFIRLAIEGDVPIIPLAISGTDKIFGKHMRTPNLSGKLTCRFGPPINVHQKYKGAVPSKDVLQKEADALMEIIKGLLVSV